MIETRLFRFMLLMVATVALGGLGLWAYQVKESGGHAARFEQLAEYQEKMTSTCAKTPNFPACISNEDYLIRRLTTLNAGIQASRSAEEILPWALLTPLSIIVLFYAVRWGLTGRLRPLWLLRRPTE